MCHDGASGQLSINKITLKKHIFGSGIIPACAPSASPVTRCGMQQYGTGPVLSNLPSNALRKV
jgi:hypothetical protein